MPPSNVFPKLLNEVAMAIVTGRLPAGQRLTLSDLEAQFGVSRTLARDVVKTLEGVGLLVAKRRSGIVVQPRESWRVLDPQVIEWRLASQERLAQIASLTEVRRAIEPMAAGLAADRRSEEQATRLSGLAAELDNLGSQGLGRSERYLQVDIEFHALVLEMTGNEMLIAMQGMIAEVLRGRSVHGLMPVWPSLEAQADHGRIAAAIAAGDASAAEKTSRRQMDDLQSELVDAPRPWPKPVDAARQ